jgi:two-component system sensor kinase FixL
VTTGFFSVGTQKTLTAAFVAVGVIAIADRAIGNTASLGLLYMLPMVVAATVLRPAPIVALAAVCSSLRSWFDIPAPPLEMLLRYLFAFVTYAGAGLFVVVLIRNRAVTLEHLATLRREQELRRDAEEQLKILVESSPAAILTLDSAGVVLAANKAANSLLMLPDDMSLRGKSIAEYLPVLADALQFDFGPEILRTAAQCQGVRENGEVFLASMWFSSWTSPEGKRLAAIVVDSSEEMRDREEENLRQLLHVNGIAASAVSHEVRNLCGAISVVSSNLRENHLLAGNADIQALTSLAGALEKVSSMELLTSASETLDNVNLRTVLDDLRIVIEPQWREIGGRVRWRFPSPMPVVIAQQHGLLQALLNLAQNSHRAVQVSERRELSIAVTANGGSAVLRIEDSGPGVAAPDRLFAPFQAGSDGTGLGLYVSRAVVRSYGGDLRWEATPQGSCFVLELQLGGNYEDN